MLVLCVLLFSLLPSARDECVAAGAVGFVAHLNLFAYVCGAQLYSFVVCKFLDSYLFASHH